MGLILRNFTEFYSQKLQSINRLSMAKFHNWSINKNHCD